MTVHEPLSDSHEGILKYARPISPNDSPYSATGVDSLVQGLVPAFTVLAALTAIRAAFAAYLDLRIDDAYYWAWSKENVLSFLDHPPMVAWFIRAGTDVFGDTAFGVRFFSLVSLLGAQLFLADIVRRKTNNDILAMTFVMLAPEAALYFGQMSILVTPDRPLSFFLCALLWSLVRLNETRNPRWWLSAGIFGGLMLDSKYTALLITPAIAAFVLVPRLNRQWLWSKWFWISIVAALIVFSPVLIWNAQHQWISFGFQFARVKAPGSMSLAHVADFLGTQWGLVGPILLPMTVVGTALTLWKGYEKRDPVAILLSTAALSPFLYLLCRSTTLRIGITWPEIIWLPAFAATAIHLHDRIALDQSARPKVNRLVASALAVGIGLVLLVSSYWAFGARSAFAAHDPFGKDSGYEAISNTVIGAMHQSGATWIATTDRRTNAILRWKLHDRYPVIQINERCRYIGFAHPPLSKINGQPGLWIVPESGKDIGVWNDTTAVRKPLWQVNQVWRGVHFATFDIELISNWTPKLDVPIGSPLSRCSVI